VFFYSLSGKDIKVAIYDDMVGITSPGKLMPSIDFTEIEARTYSGAYPPTLE
jgi:predicted HTH transcriptional regulator